MSIEHCGLKKSIAMQQRTKKRKGYFYEKEEEAIVKYIHETDEETKNKLFNTVLYPALSKMIESIIRRYKLFVPDEDFDENFNDTISYLLTKISHYRPEIISYDLIESEDEIKRHDYETMDVAEFKSKAKNASVDDPKFIMVIHDGPGHSSEQRFYKKTKHKYKAYSYCGTVCKNYLMFKSSQYSKKKQKNTSYDEVFEEISNNFRYSTIGNDGSELAQRLVAEMAGEIEKMVNKPEENYLNENEVRVGIALIDLLRNWEEVLPEGSNKLQKSSVLYFLREETMMSTKEVRNNMKKYKCIYKIIKDIAVN